MKPFLPAIVGLMMLGCGFVGDPRPPLANVPPRVSDLAALSKCFLEHSVNIAQAKCRTTEDNRGLNTFQVTVSHVDQLNKVLRAIRGIDGVISAVRL